MPAPLVIPMVENLASATGYAEKINQVSENKYRIEVGLLDAKQNTVMAKMDKEMRGLKHELSQMKRQPGKRNGVKEPGRNSPKAKLTKGVDKCDSPRSEDGENVDPKRTESGESKAKRDAEERITNLHRRYSAQLGSGPLLNGKKNAETRKPKTP